MHDSICNLNIYIHDNICNLNIKNLVRSFINKFACKSPFPYND